MENKTRQPRTNYPQLSLDLLNLCVFLSQARSSKSEVNQTYFFGGPTSLELILYDVSIGRGENSYK